MRNRPRELTLLAIILAGIALSFPLQVMVLFPDQAADLAVDPGALLDKLTPLNWMVMVLAGALSALMLQATPWVWLVSPIFLVVTIWNNWLIGEVNGGMWRVVTLLASLAVIGTQSLLFRTEVYHVLTHPGLRWWRAPRRRRASVEARLCPVSGGELLARTYDISEVGAFVSIREAAWHTSHEGSFRKITVGSYCNLRLRLSQTVSVTCTAQVVRKSEARGRYPAGFGLRFVGMGATERKQVETFLKELEAERQQAVTDPVPADQVAATPEAAPAAVRSAGSRAA